MLPLLAAVDEIFAARPTMVDFCSQRTTFQLGQNGWTLAEIGERLVLGPLVAMSAAVVGSARAASAWCAVHGEAKRSGLASLHCRSRSVGGARGGAPAGRGGGPRSIG